MLGDVARWRWVIGRNTLEGAFLYSSLCSLLSGCTDWSCFHYLWFVLSPCLFAIMLLQCTLSVLEPTDYRPTSLKPWAKIKCNYFKFGVPDIFFVCNGKEIITTNHFLSSSLVPYVMRMCISCGFVSELEYSDFYKIWDIKFYF